MAAKTERRVMNTQLAISRWTLKNEDQTNVQLVVELLYPLDSNTNQTVLENQTQSTKTWNMIAASLNHPTWHGIFMVHNSVFPP